MINKKPLAAAVAAIVMGVAQVGAADSVRDFSQSVTYEEFRGTDSSYQVRASDIIGADIISADNEDVGDVDDLIVTRDGGELLAILELGGFLGLGEKIVAVPLSDLRMDADGDEVYIDLTEEQVEEMDEFSYDDNEGYGRERLAYRAEGRSMVDETREQTKKAWAEVKEGWAEFKVAAASQWNKLTDEDLEEVDGDRDKLLERLHARYDDPKPTAEDVESWRRQQVN